MKRRMNAPAGRVMELALLNLKVHGPLTSQQLGDHMKRGKCIVAARLRDMRKRGLVIVVGRTGHALLWAAACAPTLVSQND